MTKEIFDRTRPHKNIGDIIENDRDNNSNRKGSQINSLLGNKPEVINYFNKKMLENLINQYGEVEGKKIFESVKLQTAPYEDYQNINATLEEKEDGVGPIRSGR